MDTPPVRTLNAPGLVAFADLLLGLGTNEHQRCSLRNARTPP
ncbi:hypothetical protein [Deinococcus ficus]|nr:hypothetical protein [Deinococcus ficus]